MNINIKTQSISLTPAITDYINRRMEPLSKFVGEHQSDAVLFIQVGKTSQHHHAGDNVFAAEANLDAGTMHLRAEAFDADLYAAIDKLKDEMTRELTSHKSRQTTLLRKSGQKIKSILRGLGGKH